MTEELCQLKFDLEDEDEMFTLFLIESSIKGLDTDLGLYCTLTAIERLMKDGGISQQDASNIVHVGAELYKAMKHNDECTDASAE